MLVRMFMSVDLAYSFCVCNMVSVIFGKENCVIVYDLITNKFTLFSLYEDFLQGPRTRTIVKLLI